MAELTTNQIIKLVVGIFVVVVVIISVAVAFNNYIIPYFEGLFPSVEVDLDDPFYTDLMKPENLVASTVHEAVKAGVDKYWVYDKEGKKTKYYIGGRWDADKNEFHMVEAGKDSPIGYLEEESGKIKVTIKPEYQNKDLFLKNKLNDAYLVKDAFFNPNQK